MAQLLATTFHLKRPSVLPGFGLTLGFSLTYLSLVVLIPLAGLVLRPVELGWSGFWSTVGAPRVLAALRLSFGASLIAAAINAVFGLIVAWVLVRYRLPAKRVIDALVDKVVDKHGTREVAQAYLDYLYTPEGQEIVAKNYYRPRLAAVAERYAGKFPKIPLFTVDEVFGGWQKAQATHFADGGVFDQIYKPGN